MQYATSVDGGTLSARATRSASAVSTRLLGAGTVLAGGGTVDDVSRFRRQQIRNELPDPYIVEDVNLGARIQVDQNVEIAIRARFAAGGGPDLSAGDQSCAPGDGDLLGYGRADPAKCLPARLQPGGGRGNSLDKPLEAFLAQLKEESTPMAEGYQRLERILRGEETQN